MEDETNLPWPGYRLRPGWRMLAVGEIHERGDVVTALTNTPTIGWIETGLIGYVVTCDCHNVACRRTDQNATLPPVEPIPAELAKAEPGDDVRKALEVVGDTISDLRRERDELRKQVETLTLAYSEACKENGILTVERDALRGQLDEANAERDAFRASSETASRLVGELTTQVESLTTTCEGLELERAMLGNELHRMQSTPAAQVSASPVPPKRLEWWDFNGGQSWSTGREYVVTVQGSGKFAGYRRDEGGGLPAVGGYVETAAEAREACQRHADEQKRLTVAEQQKAETPADAIQWPDGAIALTRDFSGKLYFTGSHSFGWCLTSYIGPDPFPPGLPWDKCYIINPAVLGQQRRG